MDALRGAHPNSPAARHGLDLVGPDARRVDDAPRVDLDVLAALEAADLHACDALTGFDEAHRPRAARDGSPVRAGRAHQREGVTGVVDLGVVVLDGPHEGVASQGREALQGAAAAVVPVPGEGAPPRQQVVEEDPRTHVAALPDAVGQGQHEGNGTHQMRAEVGEHEGLLGEGFPDQREVELLEVSQPAVDQLARAARGAGRPVALLDQCDREAASRGVERRSGTGHPPTDDRDVEGLLRHAAERLRAVFRSESGRAQATLQRLAWRKTMAARMLKPAESVRAWATLSVGRCPKPRKSMAGVLMTASNRPVGLTSAVWLALAALLLAACDAALDAPAERSESSRETVAEARPERPAKEEFWVEPDDVVGGPRCPLALRIARTRRGTRCRQREDVQDRRPHALRRPRLSASGPLPGLLRRSGWTGGRSLRSAPLAGAFAA